MRWGDYPGLSGWANVIIQELESRRKGRIESACRDVMLLALKIKEGNELRAAGRF